MSEILPNPGLQPIATVTVDTIRTIADVASLKPDYERLNRIARNTLPFALHEWHLTWCDTFLNCSSRIQEEILFYVLRNARRECVAIIPLIVARRRLGPLKIVSVGLLGADPAITEIRGALIEPGYEELTASVVSDQLAARGGWDWIEWVGMNAAFANALKIDHLHPQPGLSAYVLDMPNTWEAFRTGLKRNIRESLRHCYNSLKRDGHRFTFDVIEQPAEVRTALERFLRLHSKRANLKTAAIHMNRFSSRVSRDFLYTLCERLAERGALRVFQLSVGSDVVAMRIGFIVGDSLYLYYSGFDPGWSRYSVMTTTMAEAIKYAIAHGITSVNLSPTKDVAKTRWGPREITYHAAYQEGSRLRSAMARRVYLKARSGEGLQAWALQRLIPARRNWQ